jgi:hypothetical protein
MGVCMSRSRRQRSLTIGARRLAALLALAALTSAASATAAAAADRGLIVIPTPASGPVLSYFRLSVARGAGAPAGSILLRNTSASTLTIALGAVDGRTLDTLGSSYAPPGSRRHGATRWVRVGKRRVGLEALHQRAETARRGAAIASVVRYVIGVEARVPGARHAKIQFTGARVERQPSALVFLLDARNRGNAILQNVAGKALVTRGKRRVASIVLGPGTFVTRSRIAYPVPAPGERPAQGTVYRVRAYLRYAGGIARLDTLVRFGQADALRQQTYGGPKLPSHGSSLPAWLVALLAAAVLYGLFMTLLLLRRRRRPVASSGAQ